MIEIRNFKINGAGARVSKNSSWITGDGYRSVISLYVPVLVKESFMLRSLWASFNRLLTEHITQDMYF